MKYRVVLLALFLTMTYASLNAQTIDDSQITSSGVIWWETFSDPGFRLYADPFFTGGLTAVPGANDARARRSYEIPHPLPFYFFEYRVDFDYSTFHALRPPTRFGFRATPCVEDGGDLNVSINCMRGLWREAGQDGDGNWLLTPGPVDVQGLPSFTATLGDRFAVEWRTDNGTDGSQFLFYKNRTVVFSTTVLPALPYRKTYGYHLAATFAPSGISQGAIDMREYSYLP